MSASTFVDPDPAHLALFYSADGSKAIHYRFTAEGAASLYTSTGDMTRFLQAQVPGPGGARPGRGVLQPSMVSAMRTPQGFLYGLPVWGLGQALYAPSRGGGYICGHDGGNDPAINTTARIDPATGDGLIVLQTGSDSLARQIGGEWTFWKTGKFDLQTLAIFDARAILLQLILGAIVILVTSLGLAVLGRSKSPNVKGGG